MNFYDAVVRYKNTELPLVSQDKQLFPDDKVENEKRWFQELFSDINNSLGVKCDPKETLSIFIVDAKRGQVHLIFSVDTGALGLEDAKKYIQDFFELNYTVRDFTFISINEITAGRFHQLGERGDNNGLISRFRSDENRIGSDYLDNVQYEINETLLDDEVLSYEEAVSRAGKLMPDKSFLEELERIYSDENEKKYFGNPVHYKISASNTDSAFRMASLLAQALRSNGRLTGKRINRISDITECCYNEDDFKHVFELAQGNIVFLEMSGTSEEHGNYASAYEEVIQYMELVIRQNHVKTLCIFFENTEHPGFADRLLESVAEEVDIIELKEGVGDRETAIGYISDLAKNAGYEVEQSEIEPILPKKPIFTVGEAYDIYNKWFKNGLKNRVYKAYKNCAVMQVSQSNKKSKPYDELQNMVGLAEIKKVVDEVIDSARIRKLRSKMGIDAYKTSLHMVFTGNPGSAKTTVARLIAQIFAKEGILESGKYIECGRADLVGKYVGWTAKAVRTKFLEAKGGILFIDEAYSLVDDSNSFGDEAINTIVQEMENYREDVIVIFAGYPDKMKDFLAKNEGLRSRIAFHLDFPDYNADELVEILKIMAVQKGYHLDAAILEKCHGIFEEACDRDEFGNGRFVRNLLEQAMMAQSSRIVREYKGKKVSRKVLTTLKEEDFDVNASAQLKKDKKHPLGFVV
jgi:AAA+ superfamily predicted ATPase